ncbi:hypothetical protein ACFLU4_04770 [Chloroflexota bacterium]
MADILGWGTAGGMGLFLAGLGVFFWGLKYLNRTYGRRWKDRRDEKKES